MAEYYITGIKKRTSGDHTYISEVCLHLVQNNNIQMGALVTKDQVITLIKTGQSVFTANWDYAGIGWSQGEPVTYETLNRIEYLRSKRDNQISDNLLHLLPLANLGL